jgi:hypothetical protein
MFLPVTLTSVVRKQISCPTPRVRASYSASLHTRGAANMASPNSEDFSTSGCSCVLDCDTCMVPYTVSRSLPPARKQISSPPWHDVPSMRHRSESEASTSVSRAFLTVTLRKMTSCSTLRVMPPHPSPLRWRGAPSTRNEPECLKVRFGFPRYVRDIARAQKICRCRSHVINSTHPSGTWPLFVVRVCYSRKRGPRSAWPLHWLAMSQYVSSRGQRRRRAWLAWGPGGLRNRLRTVKDHETVERLRVTHLHVCRGGDPVLLTSTGVTHKLQGRRPFGSMAHGQRREGDRLLVARIGTVAEALWAP